jgi:hypothetical protein
MEARKKPAPSWVWLDLTEEQRRTIAEQTGQDAAVVYLSLEELRAGRFVPAAAPDTDTT